MIRILNIIGSVNYGGAETLLMNIYRNIDLQSFQFDFLIYELPEEKSYFEEIKRMGGQIYVVPHKKDGILKSLTDIYRIVRKNRYTIVWRHTESMFKAIDLIPARIAGAKFTILHSHNTCPDDKKEAALGKMLSPILNLFVTDRYACGREAGEYMFGNRVFKIIHNGILTEKFFYNSIVRETYRKQWEVHDYAVFGHVGRFEIAKNQQFLIDVFAEILKINPQSLLLLIGEGSLKTEIEKKVCNLGIDKNVFFLGARDDVANLLSTMDVLIFPSKYEGLPVTLIEAQAADLPCLVSNNVSEECKVTENVRFEKLEAGEKYWARTALRMIKKERSNREKDIKDAGYDIKEIAHDLMLLWSESQDKNMKRIEK